MITYDQIAAANETIIKTDIKGKDYAEVNQRIKAFRMCYPNGSIETTIISLKEGFVLMQAKAINEDGVVIGTGYAYEKEGSSYINKTSFIENCETSAVGRALGMCGFGIDTSVASYEEVANAQANQQPQPMSEKQKNIIDKLPKSWKDGVIKEYGTLELNGEQASEVISRYFKAKEQAERKG